VTVREATPKDAEAIARVFAAVAEEGMLAAEPPVDVAARVERFRALIESYGPDTLLVLEHGGEIVGHAGINTTHAEGVLAFGMAILPEARGRSGGRDLLEAVVEYARSRGAHKVELEVWPGNARAISLYASAGFEVEGLRRDHYRRRDGSLRSALLMARGVGRDEPAAQ
jgi:[ribosomal protein S18]-alanine N-acetyltransferase